jgi:hypothetical protein
MRTVTRLRPWLSSSPQQATDVIPAKVFTSSIGVFYLGPGIYGWFAPGLFPDSVLAFPLGVSDNVFHLLLSAPALSIIAVDLLASRRLLGLSARG